MIHWELSKKLEFVHTTIWYMHQLESILENETHIILWDFEIQTKHLIMARKSELELMNKKKRTCSLEDFAVSDDHGVKIKQTEMINKYLDLARELKKQWTMRVTVIPIVVGGFGTVSKSSGKKTGGFGIWGRIETILTTTLLRSAKILRRVLETWRDLLSLRL